MPTYEYECSHCGHQFEVYQSITAKPLGRMDTPCEACGRKAPVTRLIGSGGAIIFKGSGFYETDYRSDAYKKAAKAEKGGGSGDKSSDKAGKSAAKDEKPNATTKTDGGTKSDGTKTPKAGPD